MTGHYLGEFSITYKPVGHSRGANMKDSRLYVAFNGTVSYVRAYVFTAFPSSKDAVRSSGCICRASWACIEDADTIPFSSQMAGVKNVKFSKKSRELSMRENVWKGY